MYKYQRDKDPYAGMIVLNDGNEKPRDDLRYVSMMGSAAHTYGNALAYMQKYIMDLFPEDTFKSIHVSSKIAHRQLKSTNHEFLKKNKPIIAFRPRIADENEDRFLRGTLWTDPTTDLYSMWGTTNLQPFFQDPRNDYSIKFQMNRSVLYVDVVCVFSTLIQQINYKSYLNNKIPFNHPHSLHTFFESYIPKDMLNVISDYVGIPIYDKHGSPKDFVQYFNQNSCYPITYKLEGSTGNGEFYRFYPVNIQTIFSDLDTDDGEKVGHVMSSYQMTFTVKMEYYSTGFYFLFGDDKLKNYTFADSFRDDAVVIPVYTDVIRLDELQLPNGWHMYHKNSAMLEDPNDTVNFDHMLNDSIRSCLQYHLKDGNPVFEFIDVKIRRQGDFIRPGHDYTVDYEKKEIHFIKQNTYFTYEIMVCINIEYINNLCKEVYKLE